MEHSSKLLLRLILAMACVCADWDMECTAASDLRIPELYVKVLAYNESQIKNIMGILGNGSEETNLAQLQILHGRPRCTGRPEPAHLEQPAP